MFRGQSYLPKTGKVTLRYFANRVVSAVSTQPAASVCKSGHEEDKQPPQITQHLVADSLVYMVKLSP